MNLRALPKTAQNEVRAIRTANQCLGGDSRFLGHIMVAAPVCVYNAMEFRQNAVLMRIARADLSE